MGKKNPWPDIPNGVPSERFPPLDPDLLQKAITGCEGRCRICRDIEFLILGNYCLCVYCFFEKVYGIIVPPPSWRIGAGTPFYYRGTSDNMDEDSPYWHNAIRFMEDGRDR